MNIAQKLRLLVEWGPVLALGSEVVSSPPGIARVQSALRMLDLIAARTQNAQDDQLIDLLRGVVSTAEGAALVDWMSDKVQAMFKEIPSDAS